MFAHYEDRAPAPSELALHRELKAYGAACILTPRRVFSAREIRDLNVAGNVSMACESKRATSDLGKWAEQYPEAARTYMWAKSEFDEWLIARSA